MRKIVINTFASLDGVMQAPGGPEEDPTGGFAHGGWSFNYWDEMMGHVMDAATAQPFDLLLGRKTYEIFAAYWPHQDDSMGRKLNGARKYVATRTLKSLDWQNSVRIGADLRGELQRLKSESGPELLVMGSSNLIQSLFAHDLIDEMRLWTFPLVLGKGKRVFETGAPAMNLALTDTKASTTGVIVSTYRRAGAIKPGSFASAEPSAAEVERRKKVAKEG
jgi:dihydrofolate reductase